jgi:hypothetical protein
MIQAGKAVGLALGGLLFCEGAFAITPDSGAGTNATPYQSIVDRNVFGLKPPPPPPEAPPPAKPPVSITLTGITSLGGTKRAFMSLTAPPKPGAPAVPQSYMLAEGQRDGDIEVVSIDEKGGVVQLKQSDSPVTISFKDNGVKGGPAPGPIAGGNPTPAYQPGQWNQPSLPGQKTIPGRPLRISGPAGQTPANGAGTGSGEPTYYNGAAQPAAQQQFNQPQISHEAGAVMIEAERLRLQDAGDPLANAMPTTRLTPPGAPGTLPSDPATGTPQTQNSGTGVPSLPPNRFRRPF